MPVSPCAMQTELEDLIAGRLADDRHQVLEEHVLGCRTCQATIEALEEPHDAFLDTVHEATDPVAVRANGPYQQVLARLRFLCGGLVSEGEERPGSLWPPPLSGNLSDFRIVVELGRGGMGIVYEAEQLSLKRRVALKILPLAVLATPHQLQRFQNEARAAASLEHPNIVPVYGVGDERGVYYIAMRLIDGQNLAQVIGTLRQGARDAWTDVAMQSGHSDRTPMRQTGLPGLLGRRAPADAEYLAAVVHVGIQAAEALDYARERGIIHRDIKPSNLMLDQSGKLWVTDFGLARIESSPSMSQTGAVVGTLRYMSPEQALDDRGAVDHRSDLYSLGATLYELLTLTPVFANASQESLRGLIAFDEPRPPRQLNPRIPADLETVVLKAMSKDPADRYATGGEVAADLQRFLDGQPIRARAIGPVRRALKWARRRPAVTALIGVSVFALGIVVVGGWWHAASLQVALTASDRLRLAADDQRQTALQQEALARRHERRVRQFLYAADMKLAFAAWKNNHVAEVLGLLARHEPKTGEDDLRSFVWHYLWTLCHGELLALQGHAADVHCVAFSPDGRRLATASHDGTARLWDLTDGKELATFRTGQTDPLNALAISPDGTTLATGGDDRKVRLWNIASGQQQAPLLGHTDDINTIAFSPDGTILASGGADRIVKLWSVATGTDVATLAGHHGAVESLAFSSDGATLASASGDRSAILWDLATNLPRTVLEGHDDVLRSVAFARSKPIVATGSEDRGVKLWDTATGQVLTTLRGHGETVRCVAFSSDDRVLAVAVKDGSVWLWDVEQQSVGRTIRGHAGRLWNVAFSPDGQTLATASGDRTAKVWDARIKTPGRAISGLPAPVAALAFSPDGRQVIAAAFGPDSVDSCLLVRDLATGVERRMVHKAIQGFTHAAFSPDSSSLAMTSSWGNTTHEMMIVAISDQWTYQSRPLFPEPRVGPLRACSIALSADHHTLATGMEDEQTILWDLESGRERVTMRTRSVGNAVSQAFSPDSLTLATGSYDGFGQIWDVPTGKERATLRGHLSQIHRLVFSPDSSTLATASTDRTVKLWDVATGAEVATFQGHSAPVRAVAFSLDGRTLASGGDDGTVRLWDIATCQELIALDDEKGSVHSVAFSPVGHRLASGGAALDGRGQIILSPPVGDRR